VAAKKAASKKAKTAKDRPLTPKREKFVRNYIENGGNGKKAAVDAGFAPGASAEVEASRLLRNAKVQEKIRERLDAAQLLGDFEIVGTLAEHMRADLADIVPDDEMLRQARANGVSHLIKKLKIRTRYLPQGRGKEPIKEVTHEIQIHDSQSAARTLAKIRGLEKMPDENPQFAERFKRRYERAVEKFIEAKLGRGEECSREEAITALSQIEPEINEYVN
jgi:hypothetical protein